MTKKEFVWNADKILETALNGDSTLARRQLHSL